MFRTISIIVLSLVISFGSVTAQANSETKPQSQQTKITFYDAKTNQNDQTKLVKGTELTPDCEFAWTVQRKNTSAGLQVIEVNNGKLSYQIVPSRGMAIQKVTMGEQSPEWNSPVFDIKPASLVEVIVDQAKPYKITIKGSIDITSDNESKLITEISTVPGTSTFQISNTIDFANLVAKAAEKPAIKLSDLAKSAETWEPSFTEYFGKQAPDFTLTDLTGKTHKVSDFKGKNLILNVWATWCPPCKREIPDFIELRKEVSEDELAILGVSTESGQDSTVKKFVEDNKMNYTISVADFTKLAAPYSKVSAIPTTFFIDKEGKIKFATIGVLTLKDTKNILQAQ